MNTIIIDATGESIFLMLINDSHIYNISHKNSKTNYEKLMLLVNNYFIHFYFFILYKF